MDILQIWYFLREFMFYDLISEVGKPIDKLRRYNLLGKKFIMAVNEIAKMNLRFS